MGPREVLRFRALDLMWRNLFFPLLYISLVSDAWSVSVADEARETLKRVLQEESKWIKVHAAEALLPFGETERVARVFLSENEQFGQEPAYRIGIWRVLAQARSPERSYWHQKITEAFRDKNAVDRLFALESLCKLGDPLDASILRDVVEWAVSAAGRERVFAEWLDWQQGDATALARLTAALSSSDPLARLRASYILRQIGSREAPVLAALAHAAAVEPADTPARPYVVGAAFALKADPARLKEWRRELEERALSGVPGSAYEAFQSLQPDLRADDIARVRGQLHAAHGDIRIAASQAILIVASKSHE